MKLWIVFQFRGEHDGDPILEFQGVFSTEELANKACRDSTYFMDEIELDVEEPHDAVPFSNRAYWPRLQD